VDHESPADQVRLLVDEACNGGNIAALERVLAAPAHTVGARLQLPQHLPKLLVDFRAAVPDARWTIEEQIAQGEAVVTRLSVEGTFSGPLLGLAPPGRPAIVTGVAISRFVSGYLVGLWLQADLLGLLLQLGVLPPLDLAQAVALAQIDRVGMVMAGGAERDNGPTPKDIR
jgi:predicted ester cyclase